MKAIFTALFWPQEDGSGYNVEVPDVPGCVTSGKDMMDAMEMARDALGGCLCVLEDEDVPLPTPRTLDEMEKRDGAVYALIDVDTVKYRRDTDTRAVRRNVSVPAWLDAMATRRGISYSRVLQEALREKLGA